MPAGAAAEPETLHPYLVAEKVYAFSNPEALMEDIEVLRKERLEVALGLMPVYAHTDYPAMLEFAEVIRYAQAEGCRILLHFPYIQKPDVTVEEVRRLLQDQYAMYEEMGIFPRGILFGEDNGAHSWMLEELEESFPIFQMDAPGLEYYVEGLNESFPLLRTEGLPERDYPYVKRAIPEQFDFQGDMADRISVSLESENKVLIVVVLLGIAVFSGMIVYARRRNRREFLRQEDKR